MATRGGQTHNKRARELALKEKRERKQAKKDDRRAGIYPETLYDETAPGDEIAPGEEMAPRDETAPGDERERPDTDLEP